MYRTVYREPPGARAFRLKDHPVLALSGSESTPETPRIANLTLLTISLMARSLANHLRATIEILCEKGSQVQLQCYRP